MVREWSLREGSRSTNAVLSQNNGQSSDEAH